MAYPWEEAPELGRAAPVADGLLWIRMPLPMALNHVNVWALRDGDGWTVVDTGVTTPETRAAWDEVLAGAMGGRPVRRVICTHMHPDHIGMAGDLCRRFAAPLWMTRLEYVTGRMLLGDTGRSAPEAGVDFHRAAGWDAAALDAYRRRFGQFGRGVSPMPDSFTRLSDEQTVEIDGRPWRVVVGSGHSPEHACLLDQAGGVFIAGDQVLPTISSIVGVWPTEPDADPLGDWLWSLDKLKREVPDEVLVLPSHGLPFRGLHARLDALAAGHAKSLDRLERSLAEPKRAVDVFGALFARPIDDGLLGMATSESLAHLNHLVRTSRARRETDDAGVWWWRAAARAEAA
jgi:glyoxylase-like metal-dependent hydrolase (beta-lactamase superfamily II)